MKKEIIDAAVEYWANFFINPEPEYLRDHSLLNRYFDGGMEFPLKENDIGSKKVKSFKRSLEDLISKEVSKNDTLKLATGWLPEGLLNDLLLENDLPLSYLPAKTVMHISKEKCCVFADGHEVVLYPN